MKKVEVNGIGYKVYDDNGNFLGIQNGATMNGYYYKDRDAFESGKGVAYISEYGLEDLEEVGNTYDDFFYYKLNENQEYTRNDILKLVHGCETLAQYVFEEVDWEYPETMVNEMRFSMYDCLLEKFDNETIDNMTEEEQFKEYEKICKEEENDKRKEITGDCIATL